MENKSVVIKNSHCRASLSAIPTLEKQSGGDPRQRPSGMTLKDCFAYARNDGGKGFTLIELLVVVLIIGILAAVALPQYQKAVFKSRLAGSILWAKNAEKSLQLYVLEHGYECTTGLGKKADCPFDIELTSGLQCDEDDACNDRHFRYSINVNPSNYSWLVELRKDLVDTYFTCSYYEDGSQECACSDDDGYTQEGIWMCEMLPTLFPRNWN